MTPRAFRCKNCGKLETSDHAAENPQPHACRVCGKGVILTQDKDKVLAELLKNHPADKFVVLEPLPGFFKVIDHTNWEHLCHATPERLKELGLEPHLVQTHNPWGGGEDRQPKIVEASAQETPAIIDKP